MSAPRQIYKQAASQEVKDLLQTIFVAELLSPSSRLWIISPWISDIPVIDNRDNSFIHLEPAWTQTEIRISEVLNRLSLLGSSVVIACRPDDHNRELLERLRSGRVEGDQIRICVAEELHAKGILGDGYYLSGSMNITYNGISVNEESLLYSTDEEQVAEKRIELVARWSASAAEA